MILKSFDMNLIRIRMRMMRSAAERTAQIECSTLHGDLGDLGDLFEVYWTLALWRYRSADRGQIVKLSFES